MYTIAYVYSADMLKRFDLSERGWYVFDPLRQSCVSGPYPDVERAEEAIRTHAYRLAQGWPA